MHKIPYKVVMLPTITNEALFKTETMFSVIRIVQLHTAFIRIKC